MKLVPTDEQAAIVADARLPDSIIVQAYAGTAKTTTLALAAPQIRQPALALAFNRRIADELRSRMPSNWRTMTLNGLGHLAWIRSLPADVVVEVDPRKLGKVVRAVARDARVDISRDQWDQLRSMVTQAQSWALTPDGIDSDDDDEAVWQIIASGQNVTDLDAPLMIDLARASLAESVALARRGIISYDDQIYCPTVLGGSWLRFPVLAVDEAQDLSPLNHRMIELSSRSDAKLIVVGDQKQAIYGWRGADRQSMETLRRVRPVWLDRRLTMTFRCPKVVVERNEAHAPGFRAAESNRVGRFGSLGQRDDPARLDGWSFPDLRSAGDGSLAILCRNNAPLLSLAFALIRQRIAPVVLGRDIGKGLGILARQIIATDDGLPADLLRGRIDEWEATQISKLESERKDDRVDSIADRAECLRAVLDGSEARDASSLLAALTHLFSRDSGDVTLSTIHKAKGLEWDVVCHLDPWRVPSRRVRQSGDVEALAQEWNLRYVCETRTRNVLVEADLEAFGGSS